MKPGSLEAMGEVAAALYRAEQARLGTLLRREAELRRTLADLDRHRRDNLGLPPADLHGARAIGADILWQGWVGRSRRALNIELAQVLAQKAERMGALRQAFGRTAALDSLREAATQERRTAARTRAEAAGLDQAIMYPAGRYP